ncbi:MAG: hypothetical protein HOE90_24040 [Bacteriovoracaceae bacterium]|jgi:hypothetical protein|nr:hypothetical protein [Bacteriovoracaceae bacterium]
MRTGRAMAVLCLRFFVLSTVLLSQMAIAANSPSGHERREHRRAVYLRNLSLSRVGDILGVKEMGRSLLISIHKGDFKSTTEHILLGANINYIDESGVSPLSVALMSRKYKIAAFLLSQQGINPFVGKINKKFNLSYFLEDLKVEMTRPSSPRLTFMKELLDVFVQRLYGLRDKWTDKYLEKELKLVRGWEASGTQKQTEKNEIIKIFFQYGKDRLSARSRREIGRMLSSISNDTKTLKRYPAYN